jgi:hypothetical protein
MARCLPLSLCCGLIETLSNNKGGTVEATPYEPWVIT